jgi:integrase/recombinase XerD
MGTAHILQFPTLHRLQFNGRPDPDAVAGRFLRPDRYLARHDITRAIPVPDPFIALLDETHDIRRAQSGPHPDRPIWPQDRKAMVERVNRVIRRAGIAGDLHARPKGIRYGFLVEAIRCGIILTRTENWMGYSHTSDIGHYVEQLAQYAPELVGEERGDASLMW